MFDLCLTWVTCICKTINSWVILNEKLRCTVVFHQKEPKVCVCLNGSTHIYPGSDLSNFLDGFEAVRSLIKL